MFRYLKDITYFPALVVKHWELLWGFVRRELKARVEGSMLGRLWPVLHPLCLFAIYYLVFAKLLKIPVTIDLKPWGEAVPNELLGDVLNSPESGWRSTFFLITGILPWIAISESLMRSSGIVLENANLIKKIAFPSEFLPTYVVCLHTIYFLIGFTLFIILELCVNGSLPVELAWFPLLLLLQMIFLIGLGMLVGALNIFIRDVSQIVPLITMFWMFASPVFYGPKILAMLGSSKQKELVEGILPYLKINPAYNLLTVYRDIFTYGRETVLEKMEDGRIMVVSVTEGIGISYDCLLIFAAQAILTFVVGYAFFLRSKGRFADEV